MCMDYGTRIEKQESEKVKASHWQNYSCCHELGNHSVLLDVSDDYAGCVVGSRTVPQPQAVGTGSQHLPSNATGNVPADCSFRTLNRGGMDLDLWNKEILVMPRLP